MTDPFTLGIGRKLEDEVGSIQYGSQKEITEKIEVLKNSGRMTGDFIATSLTTPLLAKGISKSKEIIGEYKNSNTDILRNNYSINREKYISNPEIPYDGVKKASRYLQDAKVNRIDRQKILESFNGGTIQVKEAGNNKYGIRFYDMNYKSRLSPTYPDGQYLFETFTPYVNRENLALHPSWNQMTGIKQFQIKLGTIIFTGKVAHNFKKDSTT